MALNLKKSSLQRIYEYALKHVRKQGKPAMNGNGCVYRACDGSQCAVGALLTDEQIATAGIGNGNSVAGHPEKFKALIGADRTGEKLRLLKALQGAHDNANHGEDFLRDFEWAMQDTAKKFGLRYAEPGVTLRT